MGVSSLKIGKTVTEITLFEPHHQPKSLSAGVEDSQAVVGAKEEPMPTAEDFLFYSSPFDPKLVQNKETA